MSTGGNKDTLLTRLSKRGQLAGKKTGSGSVAATTTEKLSERNGIFASLSLLLHGDGERSGEEGHSSGGACPAAATWGKSFAEGQNTSQRMKEQENEHTNRSASFCNQTTPLSLAARPRSKSIHVSTVFGEDVVDDGYQDVVNIDISSVVIDQMKKKYHEKPQLKYIKMDVRDMSDFQSGSFDVVIDKGTLDSIMCGQNSQENASKMLEEVNRILTESGVYILITYGDPSYRLRLLKDMQHWTVKLHVIDRWERSSNQNKWELTKPLPLDEHSASIVELLGPKPDVHYIYVCVKGKHGARGDSKAEEAVN